jgi:hypothetical protein
MDFHGRSENYLVMYYSLNWFLIFCHTVDEYIQYIMQRLLGLF